MSEQKSEPPTGTRKGVKRSRRLTPDSAMRPRVQNCFAIGKTVGS